MICNVDSGNLMIVSDLHGNGDDFRQVLRVYEKLKKEKKADYLIFLGDLIHAYPGKRKDESLEMIQKLIELGANQEGSDVICLLGNHEFVHIYHIPLTRGHLEFTSWFENRIRKGREEIIRFLMKMPLFLRTKGGVLINHSGGSNRYGIEEKFGFNWIKEHQHNELFNDHLKNISKYNPQIGSDFMKTAEGDFLWDLLMNGNERQYGDAYFKYNNDLLKLMSEDRINEPMNALVSGHVGVAYGAEILGENHVRICTSAGCLGDLEKKFLLINASQKYSGGSELIEHCRDLY